MMKALGKVVWAATLVALGLSIGKTGVARAEETVRLTVKPGQTLNAIDEKVYGHFLEHIYHSCDGGLWGELVWNRSFEESCAGRWGRDGVEIVQSGSRSDQRLVFGDASWKDYVYTLEAKKTGGSQGFLVLMRVTGEKELYVYNIGGLGNKRHGLERGIKGEERWRGVGPTAEGEIETGRWYKIKVRCEGRRFQVWLDDKQVLDYTDNDKAYLSGAVGVGTWETQARYRNLKVTALDGTVLHEGVPEALDQLGIGRHWKAYGPGKISIVRDNPLNSRYCQQIAAGNTETGLEQTPFRLEKGVVYAGSVWARGKGALAVRMLNGNTVIGEAKPGAAGAEWKEFPFRFQAEADADRATLQIGVEAAGDACIDQVSLMPESWRKSGGFRPDLLRAVAELKPPVIRWPGGCFASSYRWKQAIGPQHKREVHPREIWDQKDVYSMGTDEFIALCRKVGAEPLIVVNIGTPQRVGEGREKEFEQEVLDWIEYCNGPAESTWGKIRAANGHPEPYKVKYWEIDNETWRMGAEEYARWVNRLAPLMRKADPNIKLAACGSYGYSDDGNGLAWNRVLIDNCADKVDYISIHHYQKPDRFADGPRIYEEFFHKTAALIAKSKNPALKIYCSEWNAQSTDWRTGLYCGGLLNAFERCGGFVEIGGPALFLRHVSAKEWDNAFVNFDHRGWFPAPNYVVMKLWRDHYLPRRIGLEGEAGMLNIVATESKDLGKVCVKVVNPTGKAVTLELAVEKGVDLKSAWAVQVAPGSTSSCNTLGAPDAVRPVYVAAALNGRTITVPLPAHSATVINAGPDDKEKMKAKYAMTKK